MDGCLRACQDSDVWRRISDFLDETSQHSLSLVNRFFNQLLSEVIYKRRCIRNQIYRLEGESWKTAFFQIGNRAPWNSQAISKSARFCRDGLTDKFALVGKDHVIVTSLDIGLAYLRFIPLNAKKEGLKKKKVFIIRNGTLVVVWLPKIQTINVYDVETTELKHSEVFSASSSVADGSLFDLEKQCLFDGYDQKCYSITTEASLKMVEYNDNGEHFFYFVAPNNKLTVFNSAVDLFRRRLGMGTKFQPLMGREQIMILYEEGEFNQDNVDWNPGAPKRVEIFSTKFRVTPDCVITLKNMEDCIQACPGLLLKFPIGEEKKIHGDCSMFLPHSNQWVESTQKFSDPPFGIIKKIVKASKNLIWLCDYHGDDKHKVTWRIMYVEVINGKVIRHTFIRNQLPSRHYFDDLHEDILRSLCEEKVEIMEM